MVDDYYNTDPREEWNKQDPLFRVKQIGLTHAIESHNAVEAIRGDIFRGAGNIEIHANGAGRSSSQGMTSVTFEAIDPTQRQAIRELARINDVNLTTHATFQAGNLSGLGQNGFTEAQRKNNMDEIKKAIEFSAEAANGGSVVVHTGEFPRPIGVKKEDGGYLNGKYQFEQYDKEAEEAQFFLVDKKTGNFIKSVRGNEIIYQPVYEEQDGKPVYIEREDGKPMVDDVLRSDLEEKYKDKYGSFDDMPEEIKQEAYVRKFAFDEDGNIRTRAVSFDKFRDEMRAKGIENNGDIQKEFFKEQIRGQVENALGTARRYETSYTLGLRELEDTKKEFAFYKQLKEKLKDKPEEWDRISQQFKQRNPQVERFTDKDDLLEILQAKLANEERDILYGREAGISGRKQARQLLETVNNAKTAEEYALEKTKKSIAELGTYAIEEFEKAKRLRPNDKLKPIQLTLENIFPETGYGSHPDELIDIVKMGRKELQKELQKNNRYGQAEAEKLANQTVGVTLDTGHLNMWRKYFKPKPGEDKAGTDKRFKQWYVEQVEKLAKEGVIGNIHLADNLGWDDSHLAAGQGNAPVREVLEVLKKNGYGDVVTSEGGFGFTENPKGELGLLETWKVAGAGIFNKYSGQRTGRSEAWTDPGSRLYSVHQGYLGAGNKPNFIFKGYSPDSEDWQPWSGSGLE